MKENFYKTIWSFLFLGISLAVQAEEAEDNSDKIAEVVAKARAYLGTDEALNAIETITMSGVLVYGNGDSGTVSAVYKKPLYQQFVASINNIKETSTLNRTEAWNKLEKVSEPGSFTLEFYNIDDLYHMQASVRDMFNFLSTPSSRTGRIEYVGTEEAGEKIVHVLDYHHREGIWFRRYIDDETGEVYSRVSDKGVIFEEEGSQIVNGVRFPKKLVTRFLTPAGEQAMELTYTSIKVNEEVDDSIFSVPVMAEEQ